jgi:hypothetical protein
MKVSSFKKFLEEEDSKAIVQTGLNSKSIDNSVTKEIINSRLANTTSNPFLTPYIALGSIARILAYVNIVVPQYTFLDRDEGEVVFDATQVGQIAGVNIDGSPARSEADHFIYFSYSMNDDGYYDCFAALVDSDELEDIMDMGGDDDVDQFDVDQKVNEVADPDDSFARISYGSKPGNVYYHKKSNTYFATSLGGSKKQFRNEKQAKKHANLDDREMNDKNEELKVNQHKFGVDQKVNEEIHSPGTKVRVPHKGKMTPGKVVRHDKGDPHGSPFYVVDVGEYASAKIPAHEVQKEELTGNQHKIDVAEPKGKLTSADFKKLRGEEVDEGFDKWHNKLKKRNWLRKKGYEKSPVDSTSPSNTAALAVRAGRDKLKEAMKHDETSHATLPAKEQDSPKGHDEAAEWHDQMARQARSFSNNRDLKFHVERGAHHRTQAAAMRSQGMGKQVDEGKDKQINKEKKNKAVANIIKKKIHPSLLPSLEYGRRELKKEEPTNPAAQAAQELKNRIAAHQESKPQPVRKPAVASPSKSEPSIEDAAKRVKAAPQNPAAQELKARIAAHQQTKKK